MKRGGKGQTGNYFERVAERDSEMRRGDAAVFTVINFHATLLLVPSSLPGVTAFISPWLPPLSTSGLHFSRGGSEARRGEAEGGLGTR